MTTPPEQPSENVAALWRDVSFWGMTATQFLGAFNDNLFKQLILLICVDYVVLHELAGDIYQTIAQGLFAIPFVLFSGFAGWLSDRNSKRVIVVLCKVAEIAVMLAGMAVFFSGELHTLRLIVLLYLVLFLMGTQSAFFGPAKYGILPEMLHERDLPAANGIIQMTTFLAIIFGTAAAGFSKQWFQGQLWGVSGICVLIAIAGTVMSLLIRRTPIADPHVAFDLSALGINRQTWNLLRSDRALMGVLMISSLFWFVGGVVLPTVNMFGKAQMKYGDRQTSMLAACIGVGIAAGCALAGRLSKHQINFRLVRVGAWGMVLTFSAISLLPKSGMTPPEIEWPARLLLITLGGFAGLFAVPLQVFLQARPPEDQKGRMIGAMNLVNWIGILLASLLYFACSAIFTQKNISWTFLVLALLMLPVAIFFRPPDVKLDD